MVCYPRIGWPTCFSLSLKPISSSKGLELQQLQTGGKAFQVVLLQPTEGEASTRPGRAVLWRVAGLLGRPPILPHA